MPPPANQTIADLSPPATDADADADDWEALVCPPVGFVNHHLGRRFDADGVFLPEQGNTVVCQVMPASPTEAALMDLRLVLQSLPFADHFAFTRVSSYHMTVFEGVIESRRLPAFWPKGVPLDLTIDAVTADMQDKLQCFTPPAPLRMAPVQVTPFGLRLCGSTSEDTVWARVWRDQLAAVLGFHTPNHATYAFHTTLAYLKAPLPPAALATYRPVMQRLTQDMRERIGVMDLARPAFCRFHDMNSFPPLRML